VILLDTHAWVWWLDRPDLLSKRAVREIEGAAELGVSAISCWEVGMLVAKGRMRLSVDVGLWVNEAVAQPRISLLPLSPGVAVLSTRLPEEVNQDPADRILVATAMVHGLPVLTRDRRLRALKSIKTVW
jgi:PIN domain nuclease of toxin-antitoxin system